MLENTVMSFLNLLFVDFFNFFIEMALQEFSSAQINAVYDISKCVAPYKRDDLDWDYGIILTEGHACS